jgi:membrane carboxypeptidase/penicillin-binding protein PbpC
MLLAARSFIFGVNNPLTLPDRPVACKTGTTNEWRDGWTMCFTPSIAVGVWAGNNDFRQPMKHNADGVVVAAPIVHSFLQAALKGKPSENFTEPEGIQHVTVDSVSGKLPTDFTPQTKEEVFASYSVPQDYDNVHIAVKVDRTTGLPANNLTPPENIELRTYTVFHSEKPNNQNWEEAVRQWMASKGLTYPPDGSLPDPGPVSTDGTKVTIVEPQPNSVITQLPVYVKTTGDSSSTIRVDLLVDGQLQESKTSGPYVFTLNKKFQDGERTIAVHAIDSGGKVSDSSIQVTFATGQGLTITNPEKDAVLSGPVAFQAVSAEDLGIATFYLNDKAIGTSIGIRTGNGAYAYSLMWDSPSNGSYKLQIKTQTTQSTKVPFTMLDQ